MNKNNKILEFGESHEGEEVREAVVAVLFHPVAREFILRKDNDDSLVQFIRGGIDQDVSHEQAIKRELREELGYIEVDDGIIVNKKLGNEIIVHQYMAHKNNWRKTICHPYLVLLQKYNQNERSLDEDEYLDFSVYYIPITDMPNKNNINIEDYTLEILMRAKVEIDDQINKGYI